MEVMVERHEMKVGIASFQPMGSAFSALPILDSGFGIPDSPGLILSALRPSLGVPSRSWFRRATGYRPPRLRTLGRYRVYYRSFSLIKEGAMARRCQLTGKGPLTGNSVSHSNRRTKRRQLPNLQKKRIFIPEENRWVTLRLSTRALRTVTKKGLLAFLREEGLVLDQVLA